MNWTRDRFAFGALGVSAALFLFTAVSVVEAGRCGNATCADGTECPDLICGGSPCKCERIGDMCNCLPNLLGPVDDPIEPAQPLEP